MAMQVKPFSCEKCGNAKDFIWKTHHGKDTEKVLMIALMTLL